MEKFLPENIFDIECEFSKLIQKWLNLIKDKNYNTAGDVCNKFIFDYGTILKNRLIEMRSDDYNRLLILLILVKGVSDYTQLCQLTTDLHWHEKDLIVEDVWNKLCDCRERIRFAASYYGQGYFVLDSRLGLGLEYRSRLRITDY